MPWHADPGLPGVVCLGMEPKAGGKFHRRLNARTRQMVDLVDIKINMQPLNNQHFVLKNALLGNYRQEFPKFT